MDPRGVLRQLVASVCLLAIGPVMYAAAACNGWSASPTERMACCEAAAGHCASISADDCCAGAEQRQNIEAATPAEIVRVEPTAVALVVVPPTPRPEELAHRTAPGRPDTYLLDSAFLI